MGDVTFFPASASTLPEGLTIYGKVNFDYDAATFTQDVLKWRQAKNAFVKEGEESVMHFDKQEVEFVKAVSVGKADVADSSTSSGSSSVDALRAIVLKGTRWGLTPPAEDASSTTVLLQFAPHEADEKTPYSGSSDSSEEADNP